MIKEFEEIKSEILNLCEKAHTFLTTQKESIDSDTAYEQIHAVKLVLGDFDRILITSMAGIEKKYCEPPEIKIRHNGKKYAKIEISSGVNEFPTSSDELHTTISI